MEITIRPTKAGDGEEINALRRMPGVFENILGIPSERIKRNEDLIANEPENRHSFVAIFENEIIGMVALTTNTNHRLRHSASFGIMVHKDFQGRGVGSKLLEAIIDIADNWLMLNRIELLVYADNEKAINLYKKFGFEIEGTKKNGSIRFGKLEDEYYMSRIKNFEM